LVGLIEGCRQHDVDVDQSGLPEDVRHLMALADAGPAEHALARPASRIAPLARVGNWAIERRHLLKSMLAFIGEVTVAIGRLFARRARHRRSDFYREVQRAGADALPIVTLIAVVMGMILAFVGGVTLRTFGATIYVADLVAIAMVRELGPIMTAIIMAGRTGSAYAAELGSMRVSQEIDALVTMGLPPIEFIVLNRVLALSLMLPLLCVYANFLGILGGGLVTAGVLSLSFAQYMREISESITLTTFAIGVVKSAAFGVLVAVCGCLSGMRAGRSAAAVGAATTRAVVSSIVWIIVSDGVFAVVLYVLGI
jgi:phospholipid/cholesterol/gamma-HCH transport system permease protein